MAKTMAKAIRVILMIGLLSRERRKLMMRRTKARRDRPRAKQRRTDSIQTGKRFPDEKNMLPPPSSLRTAHSKSSAQIPTQSQSQANQLLALQSASTNGPRSAPH